MGLGSLVIADLPKYDKSVSLNSINKLGGRYAPSQATQDESRRALELSELLRRQADAGAAVGQANRTYNSANQAHQNLLRTREVTMSSKGASQQDPELIERARALDILQTQRVTAQNSFDNIEQEIRQRENDAARERELRFNSPDAVSERQFIKLLDSSQRRNSPEIIAWVRGALALARLRFWPYWPGFVRARSRDSPR